MQAVMSVQGGSIVQDQEMLPGRGDVFSLCWSVLLLQISPNIREFSFSVPSKLNAAPPLFLAISSHTSSGLRINTVFSGRLPLSLLPTNLNDDSSAAFLSYLPIPLQNNISVSMSLHVC